MTGIRADNADHAFALDDLALTAHFLDRSVYFHSYLQKCKKPLAKTSYRTDSAKCSADDRVKHKERDYKLIPPFIAIFLMVTTR